jgi:membrane fusion protein (multidrug efflux system)
MSTLPPETALKNAAQAVAAAQTTPAPTPKRSRKIILGATAFLILAIGAGAYYLVNRGWESTDDAFIEGHIVEMSSKLSNNVAEVDIDDNQLVKKGQLLVKIDPRDYQVTLAEAQANFDKAQSDFNRVSALISTNAVSKQDLDAVRGARDVAQSRLDRAKLDLTYTEIRAPANGRITRKNVEPGSYVEVGQTLFAVVPVRVWVLANYKETQLTHMHVGQSALIYIDAYPGHPLKGHVDSLQDGTGARFSLLPPENATGNYVKVVQRVPVKIVFDEPDSALELLAPGISVQPSVHLQ